MPVLFPSRRCVAALVVALSAACRAAEPPPPAAANSVAPPAAGLSPAVTIAGSGTALPLVRVLARAFAEAEPGPALEIPDSIGTSGAVRAVADHAIAVGLASRPLDAAEAQRGLGALPFARVAAVLAANRDASLDAVTSAQLVALFAGRAVQDAAGRPLVVLSREPGDSGNVLFSAHVPGLEAALADAFETGRFRVLYHDMEMAHALVDTPNAIGFLDAGAIEIDHLPLRALPVDGVAPTSDNVRSGRYPFVKPLSFIVAGGLGALPDRARAFVRFALGPRGQVIAAEHGYLPPPEAVAPDAGAPPVSPAPPP